MRSPRCLRREVVTVGAGSHRRGRSRARPGRELRRHEAEAVALARPLAHRACRPRHRRPRKRRCARAGFSARFDAISREYRFRIVDRAGAAAVPRHVRMARACRARRSQDAGRGRAPLRRARLPVVLRDRVRRGQEHRAPDRGDRDLSPRNRSAKQSLVVRVVGNAFLHSMIRVVVGSLVEVGYRPSAAALAGRCARGPEP